MSLTRFRPLLRKSGIVHAEELDEQACGGTHVRNTGVLNHKKRTLKRKLNNQVMFQGGMFT
ncbi:hypothetical protein AXI59_12445 [Bacillus nakamurai]|uniref:hypothetical protein n=1 Tax=Bacillus nakamurai TaxID=1793963 RepID=UPI00077832E4|nr:hypothetical protein AXI59_12445 [Bacillus nakamurai]